MKLILKVVLYIWLKIRNLLTYMLVYFRSDGDLVPHIMRVEDSMASILSSSGEHNGAKDQNRGDL